jgi:hypothetical protein
MRGWPAALARKLGIFPGLPASPPRGGRRAATGVAALGAVMLATAAQSAPLEAETADGRWRIVADGAAITVFDADRRPARTFVAAARDGSGRSAVAALFDAAPRRSFVVAFETLAEMWEISYDPQAEPIYQGLVHDYRQGEGIAEPGFLNARRTKLDAPLRALAFDSSHAFVLGRAPDRSDGQAVLHLVQLDVRKRIAEFTLRGDPDSAAARRVLRDGREVLEVPQRSGALALVVDPRAARLVCPTTP